MPGMRRSTGSTRSKSSVRPPAAKTPRARGRSAPSVPASAGRPRRRSAAQGKVGKTLPGAKTGRVSAFAPAVGDAPVRAYIASLPSKQRAIAKRFDALVGEAMPGILRCIKWGMAFYGTTNGWFVSCGGFVDHVKITFLHGTKLEPVPPVGTGKYTRGVDVEQKKDLDEAQLVAWIRQAERFPGLGAKPKRS